MSAEEQVVSIFTGVNGYLDEIPLEHVRRFEQEFLELMRTRYLDIVNLIADTKEITDATSEKLKTILSEFVASFKISIGG